MQNPAPTTTEVKPGIDWAKTCISIAKTVWGTATVIVVPFGAMNFIYRIARLEATIKGAALSGSYMGFMAGLLLATCLFMHLERKTK